MRALISVMVACALLAGCERQAQPQADVTVAVKDDAARMVQLAHPAHRVVSLLPSVTDLMVAMGHAPDLIARTDYDKDPRLAALPSVGGGLTPSVEWLAAQKPDLIISWPDVGTRSLVNQFANVGLPVYAARTETIEDALRTVRNLGIMLNDTISGDSVARSISSSLDAIRHSVAGQRRVRVVYMLSIDPPFIAGPGTFIDQLMDIAGGDNAFADLKKQWPQISLEELVQRDPDVIVLAREDSTTTAHDVLSGLPGWRNLRAVKAGHVYRVAAEYFNRPGPLMPRAAGELVQLFRPAR